MKSKPRNDVIIQFKDQGDDKPPFIWRGAKPLVIGQYDADEGATTESITIQPGGIIPPRWLRIIREAIESGSLTGIGHKNSPENIGDLSIIDRVMGGEKVPGIDVDVRDTGGLDS